ncbi:MAG: CocE/NonD family hydrolase [Solirubrobacteraceae bacterium]
MKISIRSHVIALATALALLCATAGAASALTVRGSVQQVYVVGAHSHQRIALLDRHGRVVQSGRAGSLGGVVYRGVKPGRGYRVRPAGGKASGPVTVMPDRSAPPSTRFYGQRIPASGYGYLTVRDGIKLAIDVHLPSGPGPYPTLIEYSGYGYANPAGPNNGISQIATLLGFAVVDVNMRGTGCSGGAFNYFDTLQNLDGYDIVETVAHQPWVLHHKVGMMGISYGGISQLFVAKTDPPDLAAITPLSVIDNSATTLYPGGILNTGFALPWTKERDQDALANSPTGDQAWALTRIRGGDATCKANQALHQEAVNLVKQVRANSHYVPSVADPLSPIKFVNEIKVPTYMACQFTDEQTGGHCPDLAEHFTGTRHKWFTFTNGVHADSLDPATFTRWYDFLELYVARRNPTVSAAAQALAPTLYETALGVSGVTLPNDPIQHEPSYAAALAAFQRLPSIRVLFDNGAGSASPGSPVPGFEHSFSRFPAPGTQARSLYLGPAGTLVGGPPAKGGHASFTWRKPIPATDFSGNTGAGGLWAATPTYHWQQNPAGTSVSFVSAPLKSNTVVFGPGAVQVWIQASTSDVDLQATISEVRPDHKETFVQNGWLRASERKLDPRQSTLLAPVPTFRSRDVRPLPDGRKTLVTVPLYYEGHAYRAGSRIRVTISAPNGTQPIWSFAETVPRGHGTVSIAFSRKTPSRLVLPVVPGVAVPTPLPPCPGLRGEPCRRYVDRALVS